MWANSLKFAPWKNPQWNVWRTVEEDSAQPFRFCSQCGFAHRLGNHAPERERQKETV